MKKVCSMVVASERHALRWIFLFYRPGSKWLLNAFEWDDEMGQLFK